MKFLARFMMAFLLLTPSVFAMAAESVQEPALSAQESVDIYISSLLSRVEEIQPLYESEPEDYFAEVEMALSSFVDFHEVARGVMAKYGAGPNGATPQQLNRFTEVFTASLVDFYGSALATYTGGSFEFLENRRPPRNPATATNVRMSIAGEDGSSLEVQYTMFLNSELVWKLKNLYVEGINLRRQYFSRFDNLMANSNYDIDQAIDDWKIQD